MSKDPALQEAVALRQAVDLFPVDVQGIASKGPLPNSGRLCPRLLVGYLILRLEDLTGLQMSPPWLLPFELEDLQLQTSNLGFELLDSLLLNRHGFESQRVDRTTRLLPLLGQLGAYVCRSSAETLRCTETSANNELCVGHLPHLVPPPDRGTVAMTPGQVPVVSMIGREYRMFGVLSRRTHRHAFSLFPS